MSKTFTSERKKFYEMASEKNKGQDAIYHCSTSKGITPRCLDLKCDYVFCQKCLAEDKKNEIKEYRLQAFLVKEALKNETRLLPIKNKNWILLDAERRLEPEDRGGEDHGQRFDILAYETDTKTYIVLELKIERAFSKACRELCCYTSTIQKHIDDVNTFYGKNGTEKVKGYIVWNSITGIPKQIDNPWGLIEYDKTFLEKDKIESIQFDIIKEPD